MGRPVKLGPDGKPLPKRKYVRKPVVDPANKLPTTAELLEQLKPDEVTPVVPPAITADVKTSLAKPEAATVVEPKKVTTTSETAFDLSDLVPDTFKKLAQNIPLEDIEATRIAEERAAAIKESTERAWKKALKVAEDEAEKIKRWRWLGRW
jgi:hypothetical protein